MKKVLLGTSAIALAGAFTTSANAVEWNVQVGGYFESYVAYAASDVDGFSGDEFDGVDAKAPDSEIHFKPSITLDNGLKIGADIQLEGNTGGDQIDESFLFIDGSFGRVLIGSENSAGYLMQYGAPDVTFLNVNSGSLGAFIPFSGNVGNNGQANITAAEAAAGFQTGAFPVVPAATAPDQPGLDVGDDLFRATLGSTYIENGANNDAQRITYFTPRFAGFQLGASYARDANEDSAGQVNLNGNSLHNIVDFGANYVNSFGGIDVALAGRYGFATDDTGPNPEVFSGGLNLGYAGFTIGGSFAEQNDAGNLDGHAWDAGIAYETGPWGFSFTYFHGENVDNENAAIGADEELDQYLLGVSYTVARGVALNGFGGYAQFDEDVGDPSGINAGGDDVDGWVVGTGLKISF